MTAYPQFWLVVAALGVGTYLIRLSFLGMIGDRPLPPFLLKVLRYTPVAVLPAMVAPIVLAPTETGTDWALVAAALGTLGAGVWTKNLYAAVALGTGLYFLVGWLVA